MKLRQRRRDVPPLFCSDPERNFNQWVHNCFPGTVVGREEAIRQWLKSPLEARVQYRRTDKISANETDVPGGITQKSEHGSGDAKPSAPHTADWNGWSARPSGGTSREERLRSFGSTARSLSRFLLRLAKCVVMALVIVLVLGAPPVGTGVSQANRLIQTTDANKPGSYHASNAHDSEVDLHAKQKSYVSGARARVENVSMACKDASPCVEIYIRGQLPSPTLNTLTNPDRAIMDFPNAVFSANVRDLEGHGAVKDVRFGRHEGQSSYARIVIDLTEQRKLELRKITNGFVLQISPMMLPFRAGS